MSDSAEPLFLPLNERSTKRRVPWMAVSIIILLLLSAGFGIAYLASPEVGAQVDPPRGLRGAIDQEFIRSEKRVVDKLTVYQCTKPFSFENVFVAEIELAPTNTGRPLSDNVDQWIRDSYTRYWKVRAVQSGDSDWVLKTVLIRSNEGREFAISKCSLGKIYLD